MMCFLGTTLIEDWPAELAHISDVVDGLDPEFVDADGLRHDDLDRVIVVLLHPLGSDDVSVGRDHADEGMEMVGADQSRAGERSLHVVDAGHESVVFLDAWNDRGRHGPADAQGGLERERIVVGGQGDRQHAGGIDLGGQREQGRLQPVDRAFGVLADLRTAPKE